VIRASTHARSRFSLATSFLWAWYQLAEDMHSIISLTLRFGLPSRPSSYGACISRLLGEYNTLGIRAHALSWAYLSLWLLQGWRQSAFLAHTFMDSSLLRTMLPFHEEDTELFKTAHFWLF